MGGQHYCQPRYDRLRPASCAWGLVPALNAQSDIMEGHPTLGTARAVCVIVLLTFIAVGILLARAVLGVQP